MNDKREGGGTYTWKNGAEYKGEWAGDKKNGKGVLVWEDGSSMMVIGKTIHAMVKELITM